MKSKTKMSFSIFKHCKIYDSLYRVRQKQVFQIKFVITLVPKGLRPSRKEHLDYTELQGSSGSLPEVTLPNPEHCAM